MTIVERIRRATRSLEADADRSIRRLMVAESSNEFRDYLAQHLGFVDPLERSLEATTGLSRFIDIAQSRKRVLIVSDLLAIGMDPADLKRLPRCDDIPASLTIADALGWMYVVERTTPYHDALYRHLVSVIPQEIAFATSYLKCYLGFQGEMWRCYSEAANAVGRDPIAEKRIVDAATSAFECLRQWHDQFADAASCEGATAPRRDEAARSRSTDLDARMRMPDLTHGHVSRMPRSALVPPSWFRREQTRPDVTAEQTDWTIALAGGEGTRLSEYVQRRFGAAIPKQYCSLLGKRSMLQHTLDRLNTITPASRTLTVIGADHAMMALPQLHERSDQIFRQPSSRDTGVAIYIALAMIKRWAPNAVVTITPTDHYVAPAAPYLEHVRTTRRIAARMTDTVLVIGAEPTEPDPDFGYLSLGAHAAEVPRVAQIVGFVEKPSVETARELCAAGALWNTMVTCGTIDALWELGRAAEPQLIDILDSFVPLVGTGEEDEGIEHIYRALQPISFSRDILERAPQRLMALRLNGVEWSDWGRPERIESILASRRARALT